MEDPPTVTISINDCDECGATTGPAFHGSDDCNGPIIETGGEWQCSSCGVLIRPRNDCGECGASGRRYRSEVPIDMQPSVSPARIERAAHEATNRARAGHGRDALSYDEHLSLIGRWHSRDMSDRDYFAHETPDGASTMDRYRRFGHDAAQAGENIAMREPTPGASAESIADAIVDGWMDSPGHRENLLRERFETEGIGVYVAPDGTLYATQNFA